MAESIIYWIRCVNWEQHEAEEPMYPPESKFWLAESNLAYYLGWRRDGSDLLCPVCVKRIQDQSVSYDQRTEINLNFN